MKRSELGVTFHLAKDATIYTHTAVFLVTPVLGCGEFQEEKARPLECIREDPVDSIHAPLENACRCSRLR